MKQAVILKGSRDGITVHIDDKADFVSIIEILRQKVSDGKRFFAGANTRIYFKGRKLTPEEESTLLGIVSNVVGVGALPKQKDVPPPEPSIEKTFDLTTEIDQQSEVSPATKDSSDNETIQENVKKNFTESNCAFYKSGLRSGQTIKYNGSVVILGDVNPGSEVVADGNVVVLGSLKGLAHAGASGDESCFVLANILQPVQLRIASVISSMPKSGHAKPSAKPSYAYVKDGKVCIAAL